MSVGGRRSWKVAVGAFICFTLMVGYGRCFGIFYTVIMERYETSSAGAALIYSIQNIVRIITAPVVLPLVRRYGIRAITMASGVLYAVGVSASVAYPSLITLYVTMGGISGLAASVLFVTPLLAVNHSFMGDSLHSRAMGFATSGCGVGTLMFGPINEALLAEYGLNGALVISGAILLNFCVGGALLGDPSSDKLDNAENSERTRLISEQSQPTRLIDEDPQHSLLDMQMTDTGQKNGQVYVEDAKESLSYSYRMKRQVKDLYSAALEICSVQFILYVISQFFALVVIFSNFLFIDKLGEELSIPHSGVAIILVVIGVGDIIGRLLYGQIFDIKLARNRKHFFLAISALFSGLATASVGYANTYRQMLGTSALYGLMMGGFGGQCYTVIPDLVPVHYVHQVSMLVITIQAIGIFVGPVAQGVIVDYFQTYTVAYIGSGLILSVLSAVTVTHYCCQEFCFSRMCRQKNYDSLNNT